MKAERTWQTILLLTALSVPLIASTARAQYSGGSGTADDPYQIATATDLISLGQTPDDYDKHFILTADIDLDPNLPGGRIFDTAVISPDLDANDAPIDAEELVFHGRHFSGNFDGNHHTISNLTIDGDDSLGLFGRLSEWAVVSNLSLEDADIRGRSFLVGSLAGWNAGGAILNCCSSASVSGHMVVGGLIGINDNGHVLDCYSSGRVTGADHAIGGLLGTNFGGMVWCCSSTASVSSNGKDIGGLAGSNFGHGVIMRSLADGVVVGDLYVGGLAGANVSGVISMCRATGSVAGNSTVGGLVGFNGLSEAVGGDRRLGWLCNCYSTASVVGGDRVGGLVGRSGSLVTQCYSCGPVSGETNVGGSIGIAEYEASAFWDIESSGQSISGSGVGLTTAQMQDPETYRAAGWDLVGSQQDGTSEIWQMPPDGSYPVLSVFNGYEPEQLQGQGTQADPYLLYDAADVGVMCYHEPWAHYRLAQVIDFSGIQWSAAPVALLTGVFDGNDLSISGLTIAGVGPLGLIGCLERDARVANLTLTGVNIAGSSYSTGGIIGFNRGTISRCSVNGEVTGLARVGGLVGESQATSTIHNCCSATNVTGEQYVGGLIGWNTSKAVFDCQSSGDIIGSNSHAGGLIGVNYDGIVWDCNAVGTVTNLGSYTGGLAGVSTTGVIWRCHSSGNITSPGTFTGGLVGANIHGNLIVSSYTANTTTGFYHVGGLTGVNAGGIISACAALGAVSGDLGVGGLVGFTTRWPNDPVYFPDRGWISSPDPGWISNCFSAATVTGRAKVGGLVGENTNPLLNCYSCGPVTGQEEVGGLTGYDGWPCPSFWDIETSGQATSAGGIGLTTAEMLDPNTYNEAGWDLVASSDNGLAEIWQMPPGGGYPVLATLNGYVPPQLQGQGTPEDPYLLHTTAELGAMGHYEPWAHYQLARSIDLSGVHWKAPVVPAFLGVFDGNGLSVSGLTIAETFIPDGSNSGNGSLGLFGCLEEAGEIRNLSVVDVNIVGSACNIGAIAGWSRGNISACYTSGAVSGNIHVGGLAGASHTPGSLVGCQNDASITGVYCVGGVAGISTGTIINSVNTGTIEATKERVGGVLGANHGTVSACINRGPVSGDSWAVGGLIGFNSSEEIVSNCYSTGPVGSEYGGGLVGSHESGELLHCYSAGTLTNANASGGGLSGYVPWSSDTYITNCFWDTIASQMTASNGGTGLETAEMQEAQTFLDAGWDFIGETANGTEDIWWIDEGNDYPRLWWEALGE